MNSVEMVHVMRGTMIESVHRGIVSLMNTRGEEEMALGDTEEYTFFRSSAKPIQALPLITTGAAQAFELTPRELAIVCASHSGEPIHVETVQGMLARGGLDESHLQCGAHLPYDQKAAHALLRAGEEPTPLHNNCSGKHAGMLLLCRHMGWDLQEYLHKDHPLQRMMHETIAELGGLSPEEVERGVDGCGVVVFGLPVATMAYLFARLANPQDMPSPYAEAAQVIGSAMQGEPYMVAGRDRLCTELMTHTHGTILSKGGAEGVYCLGIRGKQLGLALKIEDGRGRGIGPVLMEILGAMDLLEDEEREALSHYARPLLKNHRGDIVGHLEIAFSLNEEQRRDLLLAGSVAHGDCS